MDDFKNLNEKLTNISESVTNYLQIHDKFVKQLEINFNDLLEKSKNEFSDKIQEINLNINDIKNELKTKESNFKELKKKGDKQEFEENNFTRVSLIKQQDKTIQQCNFKINELESKIDFLSKQNRSLKSNKETNSSKKLNKDSEVKNDNSINNSTNDSELQTTKNNLNSNTNTNSNTSNDIEPKSPSSESTTSNVSNDEKPKKKRGRKPKKKSTTTPKTKSNLKESKAKESKSVDEEPTNDESKTSKKIKKSNNKDNIKKESKNKKIEVTKPDFDDVDIIEIKNKSFYIDTNNNNVFEITDDDEIGIFIGIKSEIDI